MLRALSVRNFAVVESIDVEFEPGFAVLTGETGAGKSILVDALALLLGGRFDALQLRGASARAELSAVFDVADCAAALAWLEAEGLASDAGDASGELVLRRQQDTQGRSRAWINGQPVAIAQLAALGTLLVDLHGQHAHQALVHAGAQRALLDAYGGALSLADDAAGAWRELRDAEARRAAAATAASASVAERDMLSARLRELEALAAQPGEWDELAARQRLLAHARALQQAAGEASDALADGDDALVSRLARIGQRLAQAAAIDPALGQIAELIAPASIQLDEAARALRDYLRRQELDPGELDRTEARIAAMHETARRHRVRPEELPEFEAATRARQDEIAQESDLAALTAAVDAASRRYEMLAAELSAKRRAAAAKLARRVTAAMQTLAMKGGRFDVRLEPLREAASYGREEVEFAIATHPKQTPGPLARVASGGELARVALAIQVSSSEVAAVPTLVFDEVDAGIGGAVAATVGKLLQALAERRQVLCVTHLAQVAAHADHHYRVVKSSARDGVSSSLDALAGSARVDELARMIAGSEVTPKTIAHADELYRGGVRSCLLPGASGRSPARKAKGKT